MPEGVFLISSIFWLFFFFFSEFPCTGRVWTEFGVKFFFFPFLASTNPFWIEIKSELTFLIFWIILLFFIWNFLARVGQEKNSGVKFFALFVGLSHPVLAKNNARNRFFNFLIFFSIFFGIFLPGSSMNGIWV